MTKKKDFDPVKKVIGGEQAEAIVWTTNSLNAAVEAIKKGLPLKANPFIGKDILLLKPDLVYERTQEEIDDYIHCMNDPVYFASKCKLMTPKGLNYVTLRDYQEDYLRHVSKNRFSILLSCRQAGKSVTTGISILHKILFNVDKNGLILSKSGPAGQDLLKKIKDMYLYLPYHLKCGTHKWNQTEISFDNNSTLSTEPFSPTAGLGKTINFLILDEFAWCPPNDVELFYNNIIPTVTTDPTANVCIMSTQNGFNLFYQLWHGAETGKNIYAPFKVDWWQVPNYNPETKQWEKRDDNWRKNMIGVLGSEEKFYYQYGTMFSASDKCLVSRECLTKIRENTKLFVSFKDNPWYVGQYTQYFSYKEGYAMSKDKYYIVLVDLAEGGGGDYTIFNILEVVDEDHLEQVAKWHSNQVDLEHAALEFWLMFGQLFGQDKAIISIEWNTYGALFYMYLSQLNEVEYKPEDSWRFNVVTELDTSCIARYKKGNQEEEIANLPGQYSKHKQLPGIRLSSANKKASCALLKMKFEKFLITITDLTTVSELENFEDKNGNGSYAAGYGHDDIIMTFAQIPMLENTPKYKDFIEEYKMSKISGAVYSNMSDINELYAMPRNSFFEHNRFNSLF